MKKMLVIALVLLPLVSFGQKKAQLEYDVNFEYYFSNDEFGLDYQPFMQSGTYNSARLSPYIGVGFTQSSKVSHRVMAGIDVLKNMGEYPVGNNDSHVWNWDLFQEITLWYDIEAKLDRRTTLKGYVGSFPRRFSAFGRNDRTVSDAFLTDSWKFQDNNVDGFLVNVQRPHAYAELGLDWAGKFGQDRREELKFFSYGKGDLTSWLSLGWAFKGHHYSWALNYGNVVDDILASPFVEFNLKGLFRKEPQAFSVTLNYLHALQQDRMYGTGMESYVGGQLGVNLCNWNVGLRNDLYYGMDLMPYFQRRALEGGIYGERLYHGNPFYRAGYVLRGSLSESAFYDRLEAYYQPHISDFLDIRVSLIARFAGGFQGWQQQISLVFNLDRARNSGSQRGTTIRRRILDPRMFDLL